MLLEELVILEAILVCLLKKDYDVIILDSCINSSSKSLDRISTILKDDYESLNSNIEFVHGDINNKDLLRSIFYKADKLGEPIEGVMHFAGLKSVSDSISFPLKYWAVNVSGTINLLDVMDEFNCRNIIFSSSASIYGKTNQKLIKENSLIDPLNPYGSTKVVVEKFLKDLYNDKSKNWNIINLRYFNPIGAHSSGLLGECSAKKPNNIFPIILDVACGNLVKLEIFGNDYETNDGTCIRDYIHIMDLAEAHIRAYEYLIDKDSQFFNLNIGTGKGTSVLELIKTFERTNNVKIDYYFSKRREGDSPNTVADNKFSFEILNRKPKRKLEDMCRDGWKWKTMNLKGYE